MANIKRLAIDQYAADIFALSQFAFQYELTDDDLERRQAEASRHIIWGVMDQDQIASKLHLIPLSCYMNGTVFKMAGISSVATWPEYRRQGAVKYLLQHALEYMRANGQTISFLHPFSFAFYRKYGWEYAFSQKTYHMPITRLKRAWNADGYVRRHKNDIPLLNDIYSTYAAHYNGMIVRDDTWWRQRVLTNNRMQAVAYNDNDQAEGYILYDVKESQLTVQELTANTLNAYKLLLTFIANHDSMAETVKMTVPENDHLPLLVDEPRFEQTIKPYFMARIVDVYAFLKQYPFLYGSAESVTLHVEDPFLPINNGVYQLSQTPTTTNVTHLRANSDPDENGIFCDIQQLTAMFMGFYRPRTLAETGLIHGDKQAIEHLENMLPPKQPYLLDFF